MSQGYFNKLYCPDCHDEVKPGASKTIWAEKSRTDGKFYPLYVPKGHRSSGFYPFCPECYLSRFFPNLLNIKMLL